MARTSAIKSKVPRLSANLPTKRIYWQAAEVYEYFRDFGRRNGEFLGFSIPMLGISASLYPGRFGLAVTEAAR